MDKLACDDAAMANAISSTARVYLEVSRRRTFAMALDWPGWGRSGRTPEVALENLARYAPRFTSVVRLAGLDFPAGSANFTVVEEVTGNATTEFGAPACQVSDDARPWTAEDAERAAALLSASWQTLAKVAAASPAELRKGPRGGGRDRDRMLRHVVDAEVSYARKIGVRHRQPAPDDQAAITALRDEILAVIGTPSDGGPPVPKGWPPRYAARRLAWHVLDHAWEMEDRRL